ncbi:MAG: peptidyl-prolyl cis-trans isomerase, partial [Acidobacteriota bacterium]
MIATTPGSVGSRAAPRALALLLLAAGPASCEGRGDGPGGGGTAPASEPGFVVATVGGEPIAYSSFERYLKDNALEDVPAGHQEDAIKSSLLDQFLEEHLLLAKARDLEVVVSEAEIDAYLKEIGVTEGEAEVAVPEGKEAFREKVRRGLVLQKVKDESVLSKVEVSPGEVEDYLKRQPDLLRPSRVIALRQILLDDRMLAERLARRLSADPAQFETTAREHSVAPDRGEVRAYREEELPPDLRGALFALEPGQVSGVLEHARRYLIFQMVRKSETSSQDPDETKRRVRLELF